MREILFRGKRTDNGEWVEGCFGQHTSLDALIINRPYPTISGELTALGFYEVDPSTVGQYTGLTDKNGKKIFEGDIIRVGRSYMFDDDDCKSEIAVGVVVFGIGTFDMGFYRYLGWHCKENNGNVDSNPIMDCDGDWISEVISNIHDNPELLEVSGDE